MRIITIIIHHFIISSIHHFINSHFLFHHFINSSIHQFNKSSIHQFINSSFHTLIIRTFFIISRSLLLTIIGREVQNVRLCTDYSRSTRPQQLNARSKTFECVPTIVVAHCPFAGCRAVKPECKCRFHMGICTS